MVRSTLTNNKDWLIMLITENNNVPYSATICQDGYVLDNKQKKLFVLKVSTMETLRELVNEYKENHLSDSFDSKCLVKWNGDTGKYVSNDRDLYNRIIEIVYKQDNIKHPPELLDPVISLIEELRTTGELDTMIQADGMDAVVDRLITMCE